MYIHKENTHLVDKVVAAHFQGLNPLQRVVRQHLAHDIQRLFFCPAMRQEQQQQQQQPQLLFSFEHDAN